MFDHRFSSKLLSEGGVPWKWARAVGVVGGTELPGSGGGEPSARQGGTGDKRGSALRNLQRQNPGKASGARPKHRT